MHRSVERSMAVASVKQQGLSNRNSLYSTPRIAISSNNNSSISILDRKVDLVTMDLQPYYKKMLREMISNENALTICDYIISNKHQNNVGIHSVKLKIQTLVNFSEFIGTSKVLSKESKDITKDDVHMFDVTSLYPTMIIKYNLSPETVNCSCCKNDSQAEETVA